MHSSRMRTAHFSGRRGRGGSAQEGVCLGDDLPHTHPMDRHTYENITLPQTSFADSN